MTVAAPIERSARAVRWRPFVPHLLVLLLFSILTAIVTWPMLPQLGGYVIDKGDPLYSVWAMAWQAHALLTNPTGLFDAPINYPFTGTLAFDELGFSEAILAAPLYFASGNPVLSHNALLFATFILSGWAMWLLVGELTGNTWAGLVAGSAFAFSFYRMNHLPHMTLNSTEFMPLILFAGYRLFESGRWRWAAALSILFAVQALSGHYLAFYSAMLIGGFFVFYLVAAKFKASWSLTAKFACGMIASLVMILPVALPYVLVQAQYEFKRNLFEAERFSNTVASFLGLFRGNAVYRSALSRFADPGPWSIERSAFPGLLVPLLALGGAFSALRSRRSQDREVSRSLFEQSMLGKHALFFGIVVVVSAVMSLGPTLQLTYAPSLYDPNAIQGVPSPYRLLHEYVPGFSSMRVTARIDVLTALGLSALCGFGAHFILESVARRKHALGRGLGLAAMIVVFVAVPIAESWSAPIAMAAVPAKESVPPVYRWLAQQPPTVFIEYPMEFHQHGDPNIEMSNLYQYFTVYHWQRTVNASTTIRPLAYSALVAETVKCFPCPRSLDAFAALGVEKVIVHLENLSAPQLEDFKWRSTSPEAKVLDRFLLVQDFGSDLVFQVRPSPDLSKFSSTIPASATVRLAGIENDPYRENGERVAGGYVAALGYYLRGRTLFGEPALTFGEPLARPVEGVKADYAVIWADEDPAPYGFAASERLWANDQIAVYRAANKAQSP